jgi:predicted nucleic acid-binding protein
VTRTYVLDANAVLDLVEAGAGFGKVEKLLQSALRNEVSVLLSVLNWGEVFYLLWQRRGEDKARQTLAKLSRLPHQILPVDFPQALKAGELKAVHKLPYVDCVAAALAVLNQAVLVTSDRDFEKLGRQFPILWIARA